MQSTGWLKLKGARTGFFHTEQIGGRWWLVSPEGNVFFSKGVDNVSFAPESDSAPPAPADPAAWATKTVEQLRGWNFNTAGAWSASQLYTAGIVYAPVINMAAAVQRDVWLKGGVVDYFSAEFRDSADRVAQRMCAPHAKDPWLLGYFTDNELRWGSDWRSHESLLEGYLKMAQTTAGFQKAVDFLESRGQGKDAEPRYENRTSEMHGGTRFDSIESSHKTWREKAGSERQPRMHSALIGIQEPKE